MALALHFFHEFRIYFPHFKLKIGAVHRLLIKGLNYLLAPQKIPGNAAETQS